MTLLSKYNKRSNLPLNRLFENFFNDSWLNFPETMSSSNIPAVNVKETDDKYSIELAAPGLKKEDVKINYENDYLTICSKKEETKEEKDEEGNYKRREFNYQSFSRSFYLPNEEVKAEEIKAKYDKGILTVDLPKREETKTLPSREIKID